MKERVRQNLVEAARKQSLVLEERGVIFGIGDPEAKKRKLNRERIEKGKGTPYYLLNRGRKWTSVVQNLYTNSGYGELLTMTMINSISRFVNK